jgi:hypothetical protein
MQKLLDNRLLILLNGSVNGGKTLLYNLIKKENNFIGLDLSKHHYHFYRYQMIKEIGEKNVLRIEPFIESGEILESPRIFCREVGFIMRQKQFSKYNFVIKPIDDNLSMEHQKKSASWTSYLKEFIPVKIKNIHFLFVVRHPKLSWFTILPGFDLSNFIRIWGFDLKKRLSHTELVKIETIKDNMLLRQIITKSDLNKILPYTEFDFKATRKKNYDDINEDILKIEKKALHNYELLGYDLEDKNVSLFMKEREEFLKNWRE